MDVCKCPEDTRVRAEITKFNETAKNGGKLSEFASKYSIGWFSLQVEPSPIFKSQQIRPLSISKGPSCMNNTVS